MPANLTRRRREYTPVEIDKALLILAYNGGNSLRAAEQCDIPSRTLRQWRTVDHAERYVELCAEYAPELEKLAAIQARESILRANDVKGKVYDLLDDPSEMDPKDIKALAGSAQHLSTAAGIDMDKLWQVTDRPNIRVDHGVDGSQILRELKRIAPGLVIDSTATEIEAAEIGSGKSGRLSKVTMRSTSI